MRIFREKSEYRALTHFVMSLVGVVVAIYITDMLVAGPTASLLEKEDQATILSFIKDIAIMVLAYYFGTKAPSDDGSGKT